MTAWFTSNIPLFAMILCASCLGAIFDTHKKIDKLQKQVEHLHNKLYDAGVFDRS